MAGLELVSVPVEEREPWVPLLELADEPAPLRVALRGGDLLGVVDAAGAPLAAVLAVPSSEGAVELRVVAVIEAEQGRGVGTLMIRAVLGLLRARGVRTVVVGTASSGVRELAFYQRCGFRLSRVERDFFTPDRGYPADLAANGIPSRDMVWMDYEF